MLVRGLALSDPAMRQWALIAGAVTLLLVVLVLLMQKPSLHVLVVRGDHERLAHALGRGGDPNAFFNPPAQRGADTDTRLTPLLLAVNRSDIDSARLLLHHGASPNTASRQGNTPLLEAVGKGSPELLALLLKHGADIEQPHGTGLRPLMLAALEDNAAMVTELVSAGAKVDAALPPEHEAPGCTALHLAVFNRRFKAVEALLKAGADPRRENAKHETPLMTAMRDSDPEMLRTLLDSGLDVTAPLPPDVPLSIIAAGVHSGNVEIVRLLLARGARVDQATPPERLTPLHHAALLGDIPMLKLLLENGASVSQCAAQQRTVLHSAVFCGMDARHALLEAGKDIEKVRRAADDERQSRVVKYLLRAGAERDAQDEDGNSALHLAALNGNTAALQALLDAGADPQTPNSEGETPLHLAAMSANLSVMRVLIDSGVEVNTRASYGRAPLDMLAYNAERLERGLVKRAAKMLIDAGAKHSAVPGWVEEGKYS